jgi:hypothetical protein
MDYAIGIGLALVVSGWAALVGFDRDRVFYPMLLVLFSLVADVVGGPVRTALYWISLRLRTHCDAVNSTSPLPGRWLRKGWAARGGVERRGRRELKEGRGLLVDVHDRELTGCAKRYEEGVPAHAQGVRFIVPHARRRVERQCGDRANNRPCEVRQDYLVTMWRCSEPDFLIRAHVEAVPIGRAERAGVDERVGAGIQAIDMASSTAGGHGDDPASLRLDHAAGHKAVGIEGADMLHRWHIDDGDPARPQ